MDEQAEFTFDTGRVTYIGSSLSNCRNGNGGSLGQKPARINGEFPGRNKEREFDFCEGGQDNVDKRG